MGTILIALANQKGGVGKTTTAVNLSHGLAALGKLVVLVDLDVQGQAALAIGLEQEAGVAELLRIDAENPEWAPDPRPLIRPTRRRNLGIIPGNKRSAYAQRDMDRYRAPISFVRDRLAPLLVQDGERALDFVIFDTAPAAGSLTDFALWASDYVLVPTACDLLSVAGVAAIFKTMDFLRSPMMKWQGQLLGILPTMHDETTIASRTALEKLHEGFPGKVLEPIHRATIFRDCVAQGRTIFEVENGKTRAAQEYADLARRVIALTTPAAPSEVTP